VKVFVTGVTGFLGSHVAETLLRAGHEVVALARHPATIDADLRGWLPPGREEIGPRSGLEGRGSDPSPLAPARVVSRRDPSIEPVTESPDDREAKGGPILRGVLSPGATDHAMRPASVAPESASCRAAAAGPSAVPTSDPSAAGAAGLSGVASDTVHRKVSGEEPAAFDSVVPIPGRLRVVQGSLSDDTVLREAIAEADAAVHVAGMIQARSEAEYMRTNRDGTESVLRAAESRAGPLHRFVLISSQAAGGPSRDGRPVRGEDPPRPVSSYGRSKLAGERGALARASDIPVTILRPPVIFGARDRMLPGLFRAVARGTSVVWGAGSNAFNVVHAPDVARAALLALKTDHPTGSILYTADERAFTWRSFIETLARAAGVKVRILRVPPLVFGTVALASTAISFLTRGTPFLALDKLSELREPAWLCSSKEARERLDWAPATSVEDALAVARAWYQQRGLI